MLKSFIFTGTSCADDGKCNCKADFTGDKCGSCIPDRFNFPKCEPCNCDPKGVTDDFFAMGGCANTETDPEILCTCKGGFQLLDLILTELKSHMTCYDSMPLIGWNYSIQTGEQIL